MVPDGWKVRRLEEVIQRRSVPVDVDPDALYCQIGIRSHGKGLFHKPAVTGKSLGNKRVFWVQPDCLVVNIVFAWEQAVAMTSESERGMIASHRFPMYEEIKGQGSVEYLRQLFLSPRGKYLLALASPGGAGRNKTLGQAEFLNLKVLMPSGAEQHKIAKLINRWEDSISKTIQLIDVCVKQKRGLEQRLLTGKHRLPRFNEDWFEYQLDDLAEIIVSPVDKKCRDGEPVVRLCNYTDVYYSTYITDQMEFMSATAKQSEVERYSLQKGDIVITKDSETPGDIAVPALVSENLEGVVCGYHLAIVRPDKKRVHPEFLNFLFSTPETRHYFFTLANGATRFGLSIGSIKKASFLLPSLPEQKAIAEVVSCANEEILLLKRKLKYLREERLALMQQLLTGNRRVKADREVA